MQQKMLFYGQKPHSQKSSKIEEEHVYSALNDQLQPWVEK